MVDEERPETREGFGEASLGEAQSESPPPDPEMIRDEEPESPQPSEGGTEQIGGDQDAEPPASPDEPTPGQSEG